jgi:hypothetical protein
MMSRVQELVVQTFWRLSVDSEMEEPDLGGGRSGYKALDEYTV